MSNYAKIICFLAFLTIFSGCIKSESSYEQVVKEKEALLEELKLLQADNDFLNQSLVSLAKDYEGLQTSCEANKLPLILSPAQETEVHSNQTVVEQKPNNKTYLVVKGDTLTVVAKKFSISPKELLELNPFLKNRNDYILWENDILQLP